jgi:uncharacterized protein (DUF58 family)
MSTRALFLLAATIFAWIFAFNSGRELAFNIAYLLSAIFLLSYLWAWTSIRFVQINRYTRARRSQVGEFFEETLEVRNRSRLPKLWLELRDYSTIPFHDVSQVISGLQGRATQRWQVRTLCQQRGYYRLGPLSLHSGDPLGLFSVSQELAYTSALVIYPAVVELTAFRPPVADLAGGEALSRRAQYLTTNVSGVRDYAPGDSFNRIHWLSTARTGRLITKEFELDPSADIWIFLDLFHGAHSSLPWQPKRPEMSIFSLAHARKRERTLFIPPSTTEYAVTAAASIARYFLLRNRSVGMIWQAESRYLLQTDRGERQIRKILEALAVVQAVGTMPLAQVLTTEGVRLNRNTTILAITADPSPMWARSLREMRRRGVNSIAVLLDGASFGLRAPYEELHHELRLINVPTYHIHQGDAIEQALSQSNQVAERSARPYPAR